MSIIEKLDIFNINPKEEDREQDIELTEEQKLENEFCAGLAKDICTEIINKVMGSEHFKEKDAFYQLSTMRGILCAAISRLIILNSKSLGFNSEQLLIYLQATLNDITRHTEINTALNYKDVPIVEDKKIILN